MRDKHVANRFARLTDEFIDACQTEFRTGSPMDVEELSDLFPPDIRALIARESIDGDRLVKAGPEILIDRELSTFGDWMLLCISDLLKAIIDDEKETKEFEPELLQTAYKRSADALTLAADSPTASPLVNYTALLMQLSYLAMKKGEAQDSVDFAVRAVANENWQNAGEESAELLIDLVGLLNQLGKVGRADELLAALIRWTPDRIVNYHLGSHFLREAGRHEAALAVARRGLELVTAKGDEEDLGEALKVEIEELETTLATPPASTPDEDAEDKEAGIAAASAESEDEAAGTDTPASPALAEALTADFDAGEEQDTEAFCAQALPEAAAFPAMRPLTSEDVDGYEELQVPETFRRQGPKVGRNDPCPCGSGKKFKKCCS